MIKNMYTEIFYDDMLVLQLVIEYGKLVNELLDLIGH